MNFVNINVLTGMPPALSYKRFEKKGIRDQEAIIKKPYFNIFSLCIPILSVETST
jgi:hypothetical protein